MTITVAPTCRKKLALVCFTGNSGLTDYTVSLARALAGIAEPCLVTADSLDPRFCRLGFHVRFDFRRSRHYPVDFCRFIRRTLADRPDVVLFQSLLKVPALEALAVVLFRKAGIQTVLTIHDVLPHYPRPWSRGERAFFYQQFDRLVVHSIAARDAVRAMGVTRPILVVPHGVYDIFKVTDLSCAAARKHIDGLEKDDFVVLFFGHLEPRKGLMEFISTACRMRDLAGIKFLIAGGNDLARHGKVYADALNEAKGYPNMLVHDMRIPFEDVEKYFAASNLVALPYLEGTTSGVLKLAIAFGLPVIATNVGDLPEQIPNGAGLLVETGQGLTEALVAGVTQIQRNYAEFTSAMHHAAAGCSWETIADAYYEFMFPGD